MILFRPKKANRYRHIATTCSNQSSVLHPEPESTFNHYIGSSRHRIPEMDPIRPLCSILNFPQEANHIWMCSRGSHSSQLIAAEFSVRSCKDYTTFGNKPWKLRDTGPVMCICSCAPQLSDSSEDFQQLLVDAARTQKLLLYVSCVTLYLWYYRTKYITLV